MGLCKDRLPARASESRLNEYASMEKSFMEERVSREDSKPFMLEIV